MTELEHLKGAVGIRALNLPNMARASAASSVSDVYYALYSDKPLPERDLRNAVISCGGYYKYLNKSCPIKEAMRIIRGRKKCRRESRTENGLFNKTYCVAGIAVKIFRLHNYFHNGKGGEMIYINDTIIDLIAYYLGYSGILKSIRKEKK